MPAQPLNNAAGALRSDHLSGSGTLVLKEGQGSRFGTPTVDSPVRVTVARLPTLVSGRIEPATTQTIYTCTARSGDTLSGLAAVEGTSDQRFYKNDPVQALITAGMIEEIQDTVGTVTTAPTGILKGATGALAAATAGTDYSAPSIAETRTALTDHLAAATVAATIANVSLATGVATFTTTVAHGFAAGWTVRVSGLASKTGGAITIACNGTWLIASTPTATTFTAAIPEADVASTADTGTAVAGPDSWQYHDSADERVLVHNPLVTRHDCLAHHAQPLVVQCPSGDAITFQLAEINPGFTWPYSKAATFGERGNYSTGFEVVLSQNRDADGNHLGIATANQAADPNDGEPSFLDIAPDINGPCLKIQSPDGSGSGGATNGTAIAFYNQDAPDNRFPGTPYAPATGLKQLVIWGNGRHDWDDNLGKDPVTNRTASLYRHPNTGNLTVEGPPAGPATTFDLDTNGAVGTGYSEIVLGRGAGASAYFQMRTVSHATAPTTTLSVLTTAGLLDAITLTSQSIDASAVKAIAKIPILDISAGIKFVDPATGATKTAIDGVAGNFTTPGNIVANTTRVPIRIGWTGNTGEDPYAGIWFAATPSLSNFTFLANGATSIVNAQAGGTVQIRIANGGGADFSSTGTALDRAGVGLSVAGHQIRYGSAAPTTGTWAVADVVRNTAPTAGGFLGWVCVTAGSPGVWKTFGPISA